MQMVETGFGRKLDSSGRLVIPIRLREQLHMNTGDYYQFFTLEEDGKTFLCIECTNKASEVKDALNVLKKHGFQIEEA